MQDAVGLRFDLLNGWLFTIDAARVRPEIRPRIILYQRECYRALAAHFKPARAPPANPISTLAADLDLVGLAELDVKRRLVAEARQTLGPKAARALWTTLGLPGCSAEAPGRGGDVKAEVVEILRTQGTSMRSDRIEAEMLLQHRRGKTLVAAAIQALERERVIEVVSEDGTRRHYFQAYALV